MERTFTNPRDINSLDDLKSYQQSLKSDYLNIEEGLKKGVQYKITHPMSLFRKESTENIPSQEHNLFGQAAGELASGMVKNLLPKKMGFAKRWLIGFFTRKSVNALMHPKPAVPQQPDDFLALPILQKKEVVNDPKGNLKSETKALPLNGEKKRISFKGIWEVLKNSFNGFGEHKVTKLSGSLAYYTVFSMAPLLVVVIALCGVFLEQDAAEGQIFLQLKGFLGAETAAQLQELIRKAAIGDKGIIASIIGGVTLLVGATTIFADIQDSINMIWGIKPKPKKGWLKLLQNRFLSFSVIVSLGFLLLVSLMISTVLDGFSQRLEAKFSDVSVVVFTILNLLVTFAVVTTIFGVIFKVLPDAKIRWKDVASGAMVTAILFMLGKLGISFYIGQSDVGSTYGAAGSLVILLMWAYYSSIILYFGAEFTKAYAIAYGAEIHPAPYAVTMREVEIEEGRESVQAVERAKE